MLINEIKAELAKPAHYCESKPECGKGKGPCAYPKRLTENERDMIIAEVKRQEEAAKLGSYEIEREPTEEQL